MYQSRGGRGGPSGRGFGDRGRGFGDRGGHRGGAAGPPPSGSRVVFHDDDDAPHAAAPNPPSASAAPSTRPPAMVVEKSAVPTILSGDGTELPAKVNNKVFVDGLPYNDPAPGSGQPSIFDGLVHMAEQWKVGRAVHLTKKPGHSFGYLAFRSPQSVELAVKMLHGRKFLGRTLRVEMPRPPKEAPAEGTHVRGAPLLPESSVARQVLLSDLSGGLAQADVLREVIKQLSAEMEQRVEAVKMAGKGRKAFITLTSALDVDGFIELMNGRTVLGRRIAAQRAVAPGSLPFSKVAPSAPPLRAAASPVANDETVIAPQVGANAKKVFPMPDLVSGKPALAASHRGGDASVPVALTVTGSAEIILGNLSEETTEVDVRRHCTSVGRVLSCELLTNPLTKESLGIARVSYALPAYAHRAVRELGGSLLNGVPIRVDREGDGASSSAVEAAAPPEDEDEPVASDDEVDEALFAKERYNVDDLDAFLRGDSDSDDGDTKKKKAKHSKGKKTPVSAKKGKTLTKGTVKPTTKGAKTGGAIELGSSERRIKPTRSNAAAAKTGPTKAEGNKKKKYVGTVSF